MLVLVTSTGKIAKISDSTRTRVHAYINVNPDPVQSVGIKYLFVNFFGQCADIFLFNNIKKSYYM